MASSGWHIFTYRWSRFVCWAARDDMVAFEAKRSVYVPSMHNATVVAPCVSRSTDALQVTAPKAKRAARPQALAAYSTRSAEQVCMQDETLLAFSKPGDIVIVSVPTKSLTVRRTVPIVFMGAERVR